MMKLLYCPLCHDVHGLVMQEWRRCVCGRSGGQYNEDGMTATLGGEARVFGIGNPFFEYLYPYLEEQGKRAVWKKYYGHELGDCWWGEYEGDAQILRIESGEGPRLKIVIVPVTPETNLVSVVDSRKYKYKGEWYDDVMSFQVPANHQVQVIRWATDQRGKKHGKNKRRYQGDSRKSVRKGEPASKVLGN